MSITPAQLLDQAHPHHTDPGPEPVRITLIAYGQDAADIVVPADTAQDLAEKVGPLAHQAWSPVYVFVSRVPSPTETRPECTAHQLYP